MINRLNPKTCHLDWLLLCLVFCGLLPGCAPQHHHTQDADSASFGAYPEQTGLYVSSTFSRDGRLWRVATSKQHVYVDYSTDNGATFSTPVSVNPESQRIKSSIQNRPSIAIGDKNQIYVVYPAEGRQPATLFFSASQDDGKSFSKPIPLSDKADEANTFQATVAISPDGKPYVFWHDDRDRVDYKQVGNSIYYAVIEANGSLSVNHKASDNLCECCRLAVDFDVDGKPVVFGRFVYAGGARDHGLAKAVDGAWHSWRVTTDEWRIDACPEQGPALSIASTGDYHVGWLTQGDTRKGLFYAHSPDHGQHFSNPMPIGNISKLPNNPYILSRGASVVLAWNEFDGEKTQLLIMQSNDAGQTWSSPKLLKDSTSAADRPVFLVDPNGKAFLSWNTKNEGFRLIRIDW